MSYECNERNVGEVPCISFRSICHFAFNLVLVYCQYITESLYNKKSFIHIIVEEGRHFNIKLQISMPFYVT